MKTVSLIFLGCILGFLTTVVLLGAGFFCLGSFLVVESTPLSADGIVVLGGGDGSRFRKALELYDMVDGKGLVLVDGKKKHWNHIVPNLCDIPEFEGKRLTCLAGSSSTLTDAELSLENCLEQQWQKVIVVTAPYHSRRAAMIFADIYGRSGIDVVVVHSGDYGKNLPSTERWWKDPYTLHTVWLEFGKLIHFKLRSWVT